MSFWKKEKKINTGRGLYGGNTLSIRLRVETKIRTTVTFKRGKGGRKVKRLRYGFRSSSIGKKKGVQGRGL